ncbi:hypothetical protein [Solibacillus sp. FSL K6-1523]|uniref:hypothetical protein n=1 Tax=Solibacillus sp. FSL K6-1523 TaxID=2921471 RepID=UPI0030FA8F91
MKKYKLTLVKKDQKIFNPHQLAQFISDYGTECYKLDLIKGISLALRNNVDPSKIVILDKSLKKLGFRYKSIKLDNGNQLNSMQAIGKPVSLGFNLKVFHVSLVIELYNFCNARLKKNLKPNYLSLAYEFLKSGDIEEALELLIQNAVELYSNRRGASSFTNDLEKKKLELLSKEDSYNENKDVFFTKLEKLKRPLVGIINGDTIEVVKFEHLNLRGEPAIDFKRIEHNSPLEADPLSVLGLAKTAVDVYMSFKVGNEQIRTEQEKQRTEQILQDYLRESIINDGLRKDAIISNIKRQSNVLDEEISTKEAIDLIPNRELKIRATNAYLNQCHQMAKFKSKYNVDLKSYDISC